MHRAPFTGVEESFIEKAPFAFPFLSKKGRHGLSAITFAFGMFG